ncbi:histidine kinase dimerization/phosphoacceptor domain -containing protein [Methanobacterium alcaliphilum]|uniref:histidine kinase dimerization/phosphoacceptor domain -containing protein n=1 Tax=Methanobacterium alcaliphilum TaxID=392018 RepID=UPI00200B3E33|nr:histidine kinase dimerization/phosphoacceptor domain -containing protein [Methanobacterium alcaliphilum]MCK9151363.1 GAF domain-containing protein [Methanobacterium alcaliphilum]
MNPVQNKDGTINFKNVLTFFIIFLIATATILYIFKDNDYIITVASDIINPLVNLFASVCLLYAAKLSKWYGKRVYWTWLLLGIGQLVFTLGDISWGFIELYLNQEPFFSIADIFYLLYYPLFALGILLLPRMKVNRLNLVKTVLDILIMTITIGLLLLTFLIMPLIMKNSGDFNQIILSASYVLLDFVLIFALLDLIYTRIGAINDPLILLASGISVQIISDVLFYYQSTAGTYFSGSLLDLGWLVGFMLVGLAGIMQANNAKQKIALKITTPSPEWLSYIPFLWIIIAYLTFAWSYGQEKLHFENIIFIGSIIIVLVIFRQIVAYREIRQLYNEAENEIIRRVQTQKILKQERDKAQKYLEMTGTLILVLNHKKRIVLINKKVTDVLGYRETDLIGKKGSDLFSKSCQLSELFDTSAESHCEGEILSKNNELRYISWNNRILKDENGEFVGSIFSGEDITERRLEELEKKKAIENNIKRQKALLTLSQSKLEDIDLFLRNLIKVDSEILNVERVSIWFFNEDKSAIKCYRLYNLSENSYDSGIILKAKDYPNYFNAINNRHTINAHDAEVDPLTAEFKDYIKQYNIRSMLDSPIWLHGKLNGVLCHEHVGEDFRTWSLDDQDFANAISNLVSLALETDEKNKVETKIKESLHEKEILIKEIHHRVKNNMQIISSLLSLQSRQIEDPKAANIFTESQSRVKSMSMIHERLYQSKTLSRINFSEYITSLSRELVATYAQKDSAINLEVNAEDIQLNIDTSIPCGLILTETITNSLKYAFPNGEGTVSIDFYRDNHCFVLKIADDGIGIPESINCENTTTLGLLLICSLIEQINGELSIDRAHGTSYTIKFHELEYDERI